MASRGVIDSSINTNTNKALADTLSSTKQQYDNAYSSWEQGQRGAIDSARNNLFAQATPGSDPNAVGAAAQTAAGSLSHNHPTYSPVGDVFANVVDPLAQSSATTKAPANYAPSGGAKLAGQTPKQATGQVAVTGGPSARIIN